MVYLVERLYNIHKALPLQKLDMVVSDVRGRGRVIESSKLPLAPHSKFEVSLGDMRHCLIKS